MKKKLLILLLTLSGIQWVNAQVKGSATISGAQNHEQIKVKFIADSPTAGTDSTYTATDGSFTLNIKPGSYYVEYSKPGFRKQLYQSDPFIITRNTVLDSLTLFPDSAYLSGSVSDTLKKGTYIVEGSLKVPQGGTLLLEAGVKFLFAAGAMIDVSGNLIAGGTASDSVFFLPLNNVNRSALADKWKGIKLNGGNTIGAFSYIVMKDAEIGFYDNESGMGYGSLTIRHSHFNRVSDLLLNWNKSLTFQRNYVTDSKSIFNFRIISENSAAVSITCNYINLGAAADGTDRKIFDMYSPYMTSTIIDNNVLNYNPQLNGELSGLERVITNKDYSLKNNFFNGAQSLILAAGEVTSSFVNNTIISNSFRLQAVSWSKTDLRIKNNIFDTQLTFQIGADVKETVQYNLFSKPVSNIGSLPAGFGEILAVNQNGDSSDTYYNLFFEPLFLNNLPPYLGPLSPASGAGFDDRNTPVNIGFDPTASCIQKYFAKEPDIITHYDILTTDEKIMSAFPNPFTSGLSVPGSYQNVTITDVTGKKYFQDEITAGKMIETTSWPVGIYLISTGNQFLKVIKVQ